jgi:hypothetical protein
MGQASPGRRPQPPIAYSQRIETKREGALADLELPFGKATTLALDRMCLLIEPFMSEGSVFQRKDGKFCAHIGISCE